MVLSTPDLLAVVDRELFTREGIDADALPTDVLAIAARTPYRAPDSPSRRAHP